MAVCSAQERMVPERLVGELCDSSAAIADTMTLRSHLDDQGYLLFRGVLDRIGVLAAREEVFGRLLDVGEIRPPAVDGIATGESRREEKESDLGRFWKSVSEGEALRGVTHGRQVRDALAGVFGEAARPHDLLYLRPAPVGSSTRLHYDYPFFAGGSDRVYTAWIPLGDIPRSDGPLLLVEGSHRFMDFIDAFRSVDYKKGISNEVVQKTAYERVNASHCVDLVEERNARFLTTDFRAGDLMVFTGFMLHGSFDNGSSIGRVRLSCDVRYQPESQRADDPRYFGSNPSGSNGGGYADMRGARPLTVPW